MATKRTPRAAPKVSAATKSITRQYGLVQNAAGKWVRPDEAFLGRQLASQGLNQGQPVDIGGARWYDNAGDLTFTNQRSDAAKRNPGAAYNAGHQVAYSGTKARKTHPKLLDGSAGRTGPTMADMPPVASSAQGIGPSAAALASEALFGTDAGTILHAGGVPSSAQTAAGASTGGGGKKKKGKGKKKPGRKPTAAQRKKRAY